jgi:hypothetical protein
MYARELAGARQQRLLRRSELVGDMSEGERHLADLQRGRVRSLVWVRSQGFDFDPQHLVLSFEKVNAIESLRCFQRVVLEFNGCGMKLILRRLSDNYVKHMWEHT